MNEPDLLTIIPTDLKVDLSRILGDLNALKERFADRGLNLRVDRTSYSSDEPAIGEFYGSVTLFDRVFA